MSSENTPTTLTPTGDETTESKPVEETEEDEEESVVDPLGSRLMKIYTPAKQMTRLERPKLGNDLFQKFVTVILDSLKDIEDFLKENNSHKEPWYVHLNFSDLRDCVGNFIRQAGLWHTTVYAVDQVSILTHEGQKLISDQLTESFEILQKVVGYFIESTRAKETEIKFPESKRVPVLVVTGFLGSGKTTFLNYVLSAEHGLRIAVIENEFGEIGIDDSLVKQRFKEAEEIFEMNNGCICCTVRGDLVRILKKLIPIRDRFDYVLLETTGLADPAPIAQTFFVDPKIGWTFRLDGILTIVDSQHIEQHLNEEKPEGVENESVEQLAFANIVLLNKLDLIGYTPPEISDDENSDHKNWWESSPENVQNLVKRIRSINSDCVILPTVQSKAPLKRILNKRSFDLSHIMINEPEFLVDESHLHDDTVLSVGIEMEGDMDPELLTRWLQNLLRTRGVDIFRFKGIISMKGMEKKLVFQGVHMLLDSELIEEWGNEKRVSKAIFIGRNLNRQN